MPDPQQAQSTPDFIPVGATPDFIPAEEPKRESSMPGLADVIHSFGLPANPQEYRQRAAAYEATPPVERLKSSARDLFNNVIVPPGVHMLKSMGKEGYRALSDPSSPYAGLHGLAAFNPLAAPVIDQMTEQGLGTKEANATGVANLIPMVAGEAGARLPAVRSGIRTLGRTMETNAPKVAEFAAHPVANTVRPIVRSGIRSTGRGLQRMTGPAPDTAPATPPPAAPTAVPTAAAPSQPSGKLIDVPSYAPRLGQRPPINLVDAASGPAASIRGTQGEFPVVAPEGSIPVEAPAATAPAPAVPHVEWPPARPSALDRAPAPPTARLSPKAENLETKGIQERMREDLEGHGRAAASQEKREWFARNQPGTSKGELAEKFPPVTSTGAAVGDAVPVEGTRINLAKTAPEESAEIRAAQAEGARSGSTRLNPSSKGFGKAGKQGVEETEQGREMLRQAAERRARLRSMETPADLIEGLKSMAAQRKR